MSRWSQGVCNGGSQGVCNGGSQGVCDGGSQGVCNGGTIFSNFLCLSIFDVGQLFLVSDTPRPGHILKNLTLRRQSS